MSASSPFEYRLVRLANGTHSVHSVAEHETFHPVIGPAAEAEALYVRQLRLRERLAGVPGEFVVWDVGLGAAANVLTVVRVAREVPATLRVLSFDHTVEALRFGLRHASDLGYFHGLESVVAELLERGWARFQEGRLQVQWSLHLGDFPTLLQQPSTGELPKPHAVFFDAYSPARNPSMWTLPLFAALYRRLDPGRPCALPTYSRSTLLRVSLLLAGFFVGTGHATGEKDQTTIAANTLDLIDELLDRRWLARVRRSTSAEPLREPVYRQARLSAESWDRLSAHPQFQCDRMADPTAV